MTVIQTLMMLAAEVAEETHQSSGGLPQMDTSTFASQLFWLAITFGILFVGLRNVILPRVGGIIEERKDRIADDLDQAAEFRQQAEDAQSGYEQALSEARARAQNIAGETRKAIDDQIGSMQANMEEELASKVASAESRIGAMKASADAKVREAAADTTRALVEALIEEVPTKEAVETALNAGS